MDLVLASASPRRRELLGQIGVRFESRAVPVDESVRPGESPEDYVRRLALAKAEAAQSADCPVPVLGADTAVVTAGRILGKPSGEEDAVAMLMALSGRVHRVVTGVALVSAARSAWRISATSVTFTSLTEALCRRYWATGEPADKAGGYGIQGLGGVFVERIEGSYSAVVGLPLAETRELLDLFDIPYWQAGTGPGDMTR